MKFWTALGVGFLSTALGLGVAFSQEFAKNQSQTLGHSFVTQISNARQTVEYDSTFGDNWQSVRTFRLLSHLEKPLKVYVERAPKNAALFKSQYRDYVLDGMNQWARALDNRLAYVMTDNMRDADITVNWVPAFNDRYVAGLTTYSVGHATVEIKTMGVPEKDIKCNVIHELGHALGISGHSANSSDVMVGMRKWHRDNAYYDPRLSSRDIQAIRRLYSLSWQKGEDLFSSNAQRVPVIASQVASPSVQAIGQSQNAVTTTALLNGHTASAQARNAVATPNPIPALVNQLPKYTQVLPKH